EPGLIGILQAGAQRVGPVEFVPERRRLFGYPVSDDIIVPFVHGWNLHQFDDSRSPVASWCHPQTRPHVKTRSEILVIMERAIALDQPKTFRIVRGPLAHVVSF